MRHMEDLPSAERGASRLPRLLSCGLGVAVIMGGAVVAPAQARPVESGSFDDSFTETIDCGDRELELDATFVGSFVIKDSTPRTGGEFFKFSQSSEFNGTFTDVDTKETFTEYWRTNFRESPGTVISEDGQIVTFQTKESGVWDVFRDSSGNVVYRSTGTVVRDFKVDTLGDGVPGADVISVELARTSGHFTTFDTDICTIAESILG
jgi:hypothetical protein